MTVIRGKISGDQNDSNGSDGKWLASGFIYVCVKVFNVLLNSSASVQLLSLVQLFASP